MSHTLFVGAPSANVAARGLVPAGRLPPPVNRLTVTDGMPATHVAAQPHPNREVIQPVRILTAMIRTAPTPLVREVCPPLHSQQLRIKREVVYIPNTVMTRMAPGTQPPSIEFRTRTRRFVLHRYANSVSLNAETANTAEANPVVKAQVRAMAQSALNTMGMLILEALMQSHETASSIAYLDGKKTPDEKYRDVMDYYSQLGVLNRADGATLFMAKVKAAQDYIARYGEQAKVIVVPQGTMARLSASAEYNRYSESGRARSIPGGIPSYPTLSNMRVIEYDNSGADIHGRLVRCLQRDVVVGEVYPKNKDHEVSLWDCTRQQWVSVRVDPKDYGLLIRNFIVLRTSSVILTTGGSKFASLAFRLPLNLSGMDAGTQQGIDHFSVHMCACIWEPWNAYVLNDVLVHSCPKGGATGLIPQLEGDAIGSDRNFDAEIKARRCVTFWSFKDVEGLTDLNPSDAEPMFDVCCARANAGPYPDEGATTQAALRELARRSGFRKPSKPKSNGFPFEKAMDNSVVAFGSFRERPVSDVSGVGTWDVKIGSGPLSGLENGRIFG